MLVVVIKNLKIHTDSWNFGSAWFTFLTFNFCFPLEILCVHFVELWREMLTDPTVADVSPINYLRGEVQKGSMSESHSSAGMQQRRERIYNTMFSVPWRCELVNTNLSLWKFQLSLCSINLHVSGFCSSKACELITLIYSSYPIRQSVRPIIQTNVLQIVVSEWISD